jgi:hypothetical protein
MTMRRQQAKYKGKGQGKAGTRASAERRSKDLGISARSAHLCPAFLRFTLALPLNPSRSSLPRIPREPLVFRFQRSAARGAKPLGRERRFDDLTGLGEPGDGTVASICITNVAEGQSPRWAVMTVRPVASATS